MIYGVKLTHTANLTGAHIFDIYSNHLTTNFNLEAYLLRFIKFQYLVVTNMFIKLKKTNENLQK